MAKELPFYKFTATEWLTGDISFEDFDVQGLFISVCATYWAQDCEITLARLKQRLRNASSEQWQRLIDGNYIKVKGDNVSIKFLDEQIEELSGQHKKRVEAGRKGGEASVKQRLSNAQPTVNHKDIDIEEEQEEEQEEEKGVAKNSIPSIERIPTVEAFVAFGLEKASANRLNVTETALRMKYEAWKVAGWVNGNGDEVRNWKASLINTLPHIKSEPMKEERKFVPRPPVFPEQP